MKLSKILAVYIGFLICTAFGIDAHEFHLSKCTVNYDTASASMQISMNIFIDDLEVALATADITDLKIGTEKESDSADMHIADYIQKHLSISTDSDTLEMNFLGKELSDDLTAIWCYIEAPYEENGKPISVTNTLLFESFSDQQNVLIIKKNKKRHKDFLLDIETQSAEIYFGS